jgi:hypothetical protein
MSPQEIFGAITHAQSIGLRDDRLELVYSNAAVEAITASSGTAFQGFALALDLLGLPLPAPLAPNNKRRAATVRKITAAHSQSIKEHTND